MTFVTLALRVLAALGASFLVVWNARAQVVLELVSQIEIGSPTEIVCFDKTMNRAYVTLGDRPAIAIVDLKEPTNPVVISTIDLSDVGSAVNSVACFDGLVAVAVEAHVSTDNGTVVFLDSDGERIRQVRVGAMPDMVTFSPDGTYLVSANEGEPNADLTIDPQGSVSIIDVRNNYRETTVMLGSSRPVSSVTWFTLPSRLPGEMIEPEYIAVSPDSKHAFVMCQENNAIAKIDLATASLMSWHWLGFVDWMETDGGIDIDRKNKELIRKPERVISLRQPDAVIAFDTSRGIRLVTANEGDPRDNWGSDGVRKVDDVEYIKSSTEGQEPNALFGSRGVSIFDGDARLVWDSADLFEASLEKLFEKDEAETWLEQTIDKRSGKRGIEPESLTTGTIDGERLVFVGLERAGMIASFVYNESDDSLVLQGLTSVPTPAGSEETASPEGLAFAGKSASQPTDLLLVCDELHGTFTTYKVLASAAHDVSKQ